MKKNSALNPMRYLQPRIWVASLAALLFTLGATNALAALFAYEPYNYTLGTVPGAATGVPTQTTGGGFTGPYNGGAAGKTTVAGLTYPGLLTANNALSTSGNFIGENVASPISTGPVYISYLVRMPTSPVAALSGLEMNAGGNGMFTGIITNSSTTNGIFGINQQVGYNNGGPNLWSGVPLAYGTTNFIVIELTGSGSGWTGSVWVNPPAGTSTPPAATGSGISIPQFTIAACTIINPGGGALLFDELRLASTWADAVSYTPATPLSVTITSPINGSTVGNYVSIQADASIAPGSVTNVAFYDGAALLGNDTTLPYSFSANLTAGAHTLTAIASAVSNAVSVLATNTINLTVTNTPSLVAYEPFNYSLGAIANGTPATGSGLSGNWTFANDGSDSVVAGLTYPGLPTANNALKQTVAGVRSYVSYAAPVGGGTKYFSFLIKNSQVSGGEAIGAYFIGSGTTSLFAGYKGGFSGTQAYFTLGTVLTANGTAGSAATTWAAGVPVTSTATSLIVVKIDFNTSGANDTVSLWVNPPAGTNAPGVAANVVSTTRDVGVISGFGLNVEGGYYPTVDELRVGDNYGSVVGAAAATIATTLTLSTNQLNQVSWSATSTNYYQPQRSADNSVWSNLGGLLYGSAVTSVVDPSPVPFYRVLEIESGSTETIVNGGFETEDTGTADALSWNEVGTALPTRITTDSYTGSACMDFNVTTGTSTAEANQDLFSEFSGVTPGTTYNFSFWAKRISATNGFVSNYQIIWRDVANANILPPVVLATPFTGGDNTWAQTTVNGLVAPTNAYSALIQFFAATGAESGSAGQMRVDDVSFATAASPTGATNELGASVLASAGFTGTVKTNGVTATAATGTVQFITNSVSQSLKAVSGGVAVSDPATMPPSYTLVGIYSGDGVYLASTNTLVVGSVGPGGPALLTNSVSGNLLSLAWPAGQGWRLEYQTNSLSTGLSNNWLPAAGSAVSSTNITLDATKPAVFYRLAYP